MLWTCGISHSLVKFMQITVFGQTIAIENSANNGEKSVWVMAVSNLWLQIASCAGNGVPAQQKHCPF